MKERGEGTAPVEVPVRSEDTTGVGPGFVYVLSNKSMSGLLKIGISNRHPWVRAAELSRSSGIPTPFVVEAFYEVTDMAAAEKAAHEKFAESRESTNREFFRAGLPRALWRLTAAIVPFRPDHRRSRWVSAGECPRCLDEIKNPTERGLWDGDGLGADPPGGVTFIADCNSCGVRVEAFASRDDEAKDVFWHPASRDNWIPSSLERAMADPDLMWLVKMEAKSLRQRLEELEQAFGPSGFLGEDESERPLNHG